MLTYKDQTFCQFGDTNNEMCKGCYRFFDKEKYRKFCKERGFDIPVAFFTKKPCEFEYERTPDIPFPTYDFNKKENK